MRSAHHGVVPPTVVIDDKWQKTYGRNEPDEAKWPDLRGFIAERHAQGQRVLLWWKAWDPEGLDPALCIRRPDGVPVALDPIEPRDARRCCATVMRELLSPDGLDADGLKVDFTARTPSGRALAHARPGLGHRALARAAARGVRRSEGSEARRARDHADTASGLRRRRPTWCA